MNIQQLENEYERLASEARTLASRQADAATVEAAIARAQVAKKRWKDARSTENLQEEIERLTGGMASGSDWRPGRRSIGAQFGVPFERWLKDNPYRRDANWGSPAYEIHATTLTEGAGSGGALVVPDFRPGILPLPLPLPTVASLLSDGNTTSNAVSYPCEKSYTNAAAAVAEGALKPESTLVFEQVQDPVTKIAHWLPVTEELLEDAPALSAFINTRLELGVELTEDDQLLNGSGVAPNILGLLNRTGLAADLPRGTDTNADAIAKQMAAIQTSTNMVPTGLIMHPTNWLTTQLAKTTTGEYPQRHRAVRVTAGPDALGTARRRHQGDRRRHGADRLPRRGDGPQAVAADCGREQQPSGFLHPEPGGHPSRAARGAGGDDPGGVRHGQRSELIESSGRQFGGLAASRPPARRATSPAVADRQVQSRSESSGIVVDCGAQDRQRSWGR